MSLRNSFPRPPLRKPTLSQVGFALRTSTQPAQETTQNQTVITPRTKRVIKIISCIREHMYKVFTSEQLYILTRHVCIHIYIYIYIYTLRIDGSSKYNTTQVKSAPQSKLFFFCKKWGMSRVPFAHRAQGMAKKKR